MAAEAQQAAHNGGYQNVDWMRHGCSNSLADQTRSRDGAYAR